MPEIDDTRWVSRPQRIRAGRWVWRTYAGTYTARTLAGLHWLRLKHRLWHLWNGDGFVD